MSEQREALYLANVASKDAEGAYKFHERIAAAEGSFLWARTEDQIRTLIADGCLFAIWRGEEKQLVALCYATLADNELSWEIGGLTVDPATKKLGLGTILLRFTLAHTIVYQKPWSNNQTVIAHVHEGNNDPRGIIEKLGFHFLRRFDVPESANPPKWMKRNAEGKVVGDEFEFPAAALGKLTAWFYEDLDKLMNETRIEFGFGYAFNFDDFKSDLREISQEV